MTRAVAALALALALALGPVMARADDRPVCTETPSDTEVRERLRMLREHIRSDEPAARRWYTSFFVLHGLMAVGGAMWAVAAAENGEEGQQVDLTVGAISSGLAMVTLLTATPPLIGAGGTLDGMPDETPEDRLRAMREAEDILRRDSNAVDFVASWLPATGTAIYSAATATMLAVAFDRLAGAYLNALGGAVLGLGRLLLRPTSSRGHWRRYRRRYPDAACEEAVAAAPRARFRIGAGGPGITFSLTF